MSLVYKKINSITKIIGSLEVTNLHVPGPENYIANNIVTHNCYTSRHRAEGNPLEIYTNLDDLIEGTLKHFFKLPIKTPNQCDPTYWTYDIGENTDCLLPIHIETTNRIISRLTSVGAKPTFATKLHTVNKLVDVKPNTARVRVSLMPQHLSDLLEPGSSPIHSRIDAIDQLIDKGYEAHVNFSPVVIYDGWEGDYTNLMKLVSKSISKKALDQLKAEVIFLTHNEGLHIKNSCFPQVEKLLWTPENQELKTTLQGDSTVVRYKALTTKKEAVNKFKFLMKQNLPNCEIRYIF